MNTSEKIIVIILSSFLGLFLLLSIILIVKLMQLVKKMHEVADKAAEIVEKANDIAGKVENVSGMFQKSAGPLALGRYFMNIAEMVSKHNKRK